MANKQNYKIYLKKITKLVSKIYNVGFLKEVKVRTNILK